MKKSYFLALITLFAVLFFTLHTCAYAGTLFNFNDNDALNWESKALELYNNYFTIDIPDGTGTLTAGTPLYTPFQNKYITFNQDLTLASISDYFNGSLRTINMLNSGNHDQVVMQLHGFSASGFGFEIKPNSEGWYTAGFQHSGKTLTGSANGDSTYSPYFFGTITDGADDIFEITAFTAPPHWDLEKTPTGFYLGDLYFIEKTFVPVPGSVLLLSIGLLSLAWFNRDINFKPVR
ncbi:MAG: hypothetical protein KKE62_07485 [Proteobacteria bacterium]|nr:hypothetical protein [Pseudomonadota bacterium]MBU1388503.1 hypothetical protein [Pseudomonadota bacterium]MBU1542673.1 hypothetical protein [Pseudomonadota bacterium]MBU2482658.1 hypothetical protein [Pseudomonadota bacterium]